MRPIKRLLFQILGRERYLYLVSRLFFMAYRLGMLRSNTEYELHYFVQRFIRPGDVVIDIGANLGYYSVLFADWVGAQGQVWSVEPIALYRQILKRNVGTRSQVQLVPFALGRESGQVRMGVPGDQPFRHGLTRVLEEEEQSAQVNTVEVRRPGDLFGHLERLDYIKCDVEGYEGHILPELMPLISRFRPIVQIEIASVNREAVFSALLREGYQAWDVQGAKARVLNSPNTPSAGDVLFLPLHRIPELTEA